MNFIVLVTEMASKRVRAPRPPPPPPTQDATPMDIDSKDPVFFQMKIDYDAVNREWEAKKLRKSPTKVEITINRPLPRTRSGAPGVSLKEKSKGDGKDASIDTDGDIEMSPATSIVPDEKAMHDKREPLPELSMQDNIDNKLDDNVISEPEKLPLPVKQQHARAEKLLLKTVELTRKYLSLRVCPEDVEKFQQLQLEMIQHLRDQVIPPCLLVELGGMIYTDLYMRRMSSWDVLAEHTDCPSTERVPRDHKKYHGFLPYVTPGYIERNEPLERFFDAIAVPGFDLIPASMVPEPFQPSQTRHLIPSAQTLVSLTRDTSVTWFEEFKAFKGLDVEQKASTVKALLALPEEMSASSSSSKRRKTDLESAASQYRSRQGHRALSVSVIGDSIVKYLNWRELATCMRACNDLRLPALRCLRDWIKYIAGCQEKYVKYLHCWFNHHTALNYISPDRLFFIASEYFGDERFSRFLNEHPVYDEDLKKPKNRIPCGTHQAEVLEFSRWLLQVAFLWQESAEPMFLLCLAPVDLRKANSKNIMRVLHLVSTNYPTIVFVDPNHCGVEGHGIDQCSITLANADPNRLDKDLVRCNAQPKGTRVYCGPVRDQCLALAPIILDDKTGLPIPVPTRPKVDAGTRIWASAFESDKENTPFQEVADPTTQVFPQGHPYVFNRAKEERYVPPGWTYTHAAVDIGVFGEEDANVFFLALPEQNIRCHCFFSKPGNWNMYTDRRIVKHHLETCKDRAQFMQFTTALQSAGRCVAGSALLSAMDIAQEAARSWDRENWYRYRNLTQSKRLVGYGKAPSIGGLDLRPVLGKSSESNNGIAEKKKPNSPSSTPVLGKDRQVLKSFTINSPGLQPGAIMNLPRAPPARPEDRYARVPFEDMEFQTVTTMPDKNMVPFHPMDRPIRFE